MPVITFIILLIAGSGRATAALDSQSGLHSMCCITEHDIPIPTIDSEYDFLLMPKMWLN